MFFDWAKDVCGEGPHTYMKLVKHWQLLPLGDPTFLFFQENPALNTGDGCDRKTKTKSCNLSKVRFIWNMKWWKNIQKLSRTSTKTAVLYEIQKVDFNRCIPPSVSSTVKTTLQHTVVSRQSSAYHTMTRYDTGLSFANIYLLADRFATMT